MLTDDHKDWGYASSTGLGFTHQEIVEAHFRACAPQYRAALDRVGIRPGWQVLDAGCGSGAFLPWLAELVGPTGRLSAVDLAAENVGLVTELARRERLEAPLEARQGDVLRLPYEDNSFDAVWCANTTQYLGDRELELALAEFIRVVRPGGLVAVKDLDAGLITARPADPFLFTDFFRRAGGSPGYAHQLLRARDLYRRLSAAGLGSVRQHTLLIEHYAPFDAAVQRFYGLACARVAEQALAMGGTEQWQAFTDPEAPDNPLRDPQAYISEGNVVAIGTVPG
ncbi:class I SAM-dependent methyltransferase [Streptomyces inhibens]|uniref:class I SAM-dependent methyltransferase n=1 Tax=Streptomyces inhibens TaxID=2293571 RepID=UPI001EE707B0|nr:class I SAM-dependent methyltransferase [Streptomyces inhibens]UKY53224.1 class I SAM-dependent methyltransferase [Streptomyces inhibens]